MNKRFTKALRPDLHVEKQGKIAVVSGGGLTYRVPIRGSNREQAETINSKIPVATLRPPQL